MNPEVDQILGTSAAQLMGTLAPLMPEGYAQGQGSLLGFMMIMSAQEYERAADIRASENTDMRSLFLASVSKVGDAELREKLQAAGQTRDVSLAISELNKTNSELRRLLIVLHAHAEAEYDCETESRIWEILRRSAARRLVKLA